ncbi:MAG: PIN domain nuclease [Anaerolineae bacterium]|nr:PIN domain nuclease [Anaerolineae bacterium]
MSTDFISRIIGMILFSVGGLFLGARLAEVSNSPPYIYATTFFLVGALAGLVLTPYISVKPLRSLRHGLRHVPLQQLIAGTIGLVIGLVIAALLAIPLSLLPIPLNQILPFVGTILFSYLGIAAMTMRQQEVFNFIRGYRASSKESKSTAPNVPPVLLDTSVIIDGRIADISRTGFISGEMLVPNFILNELQHIADSSDALRRNRGRRGLDVLHRLQEESITPVRIIDMDVEDVREVDDKLVFLAKQLHCAIVTNDYNLNRVAELQGVPVLNINELANAVKAVYLPGEAFVVNVIQEGKESDQGVGYLDDGTMVVVESGRSYINSHTEVVVTKMLQTTAGRMIFARPVEESKKWS